MENELKLLEQKIEEAYVWGVKTAEIVSLFYEYCMMLINFKNEHMLTEEQVGNRVVSCLLHFSTLRQDPICEEMFDMASRLEIPRENIFASGVGRWDAKTADAIKAKEWNDFICVINSSDQS